MQPGDRPGPDQEFSSPPQEPGAQDLSTQPPWHVSVLRLGRYLVGLAALALCLYYGYKTVTAIARHGQDAITETVHLVGDEAANIASKFHQGTLTETFISALPALSRQRGGSLELATFETVELFSAADQKTIAWGWINLGTTVTEIKAPVTYRYHLRLHDPWRLVASNQVCLVYAPPIRATRPPAIHMDRLEKKSDAGWLRFNAREQLDQLERDIMPLVNFYAGDERHLALVREECRKTAAEFIRTWLLREKQWQTDRFHAIQVVFPDDELTEGEPIQPTITLEN